MAFQWSKSIPDPFKNLNHMKKSLINDKSGWMVDYDSLDEMNIDLKFVRDHGEFKEENQNNKTGFLYSIQPPTTSSDGKWFTFVRYFLKG